MPTDIPHSVSEEHPVSDVTLLEQVAEGDVRALWELSVRHSSSLRALALGILRDPVVAEQVVQATFREVRYEAAVPGELTGTAGVYGAAAVFVQRTWGTV